MSDLPDVVFVLERLERSVVVAQVAVRLRLGTGGPIEVDRSRATGYAARLNFGEYYEYAEDAVRAYAKEVDTLESQLAEARESLAKMRVALTGKPITRALTVDEALREALMERPSLLEQLALAPMLRNEAIGFLVRVTLTVLRDSGNRAATYRDVRTAVVSRLDKG